MLPSFRLAPLLRTPYFTPIVLVLCFKLLDASTTVDVFETEFEDATVVDSAFTDVYSAATRTGEMVAVV